MQARGQRYVNVMHVDCDGPQWRAELDAAVVRGLAPPTFIVRSPVRMRASRSGQIEQDREHETAHLYWVLRVPINSENPKALDLFKRTRAALVAMLDGDPAAAGHLGKNPFHRDFELEVGPLVPVELRDLFAPMMAWCEEGEYFLGRRTVSRDGSPAYDPLRMSRTAAPLADEQAAQWGRLFEARHGIYQAAARDYGLVHDLVAEHAAAVGSRATPGDIRDTARSIHRFMLKRFRGAAARPGVDHGAMTRDAVERGGRDCWVALDKRSKRVLAAERTNALRTAKTAAAIVSAVERLLNRNVHFTQLSLAAEAGLSVREIQRRQGFRFLVRNTTDGHIRIYPQEGGIAPDEVVGGESVSLAQRGTQTRTLRELASLSKARAAHAKAERDSISAYEEQTRRMRKHGALPEQVPPRGPDASPELKAAHNAALRALHDCLRRADARAARQERKSGRNNAGSSSAPGPGPATPGRSRRSCPRLRSGGTPWRNAHPVTG